MKRMAHETVHIIIMTISYLMTLIRTAYMEFINSKGYESAIGRSLMTLFLAISGIFLTFHLVISVFVWRIHIEVKENEDSVNTLVLNFERFEIN